MKILITGASSGIGKELAKRYALPQNELIILARRMDELLKLKSELCIKAKKVTIIVVDVTNFEKLQAKLEKITSLDMVVLNAGISLGHKNKELATSKEFRYLYDVNVVANHTIVESLLPILKLSKNPKIVFISSLASLFSMPTSLVYSSSKRAINAYAEGLRYMVKKDNIEVINILPGFIKSELTDKNDFKMPFLLETKDGVTKILNAIEQNKHFYPFPFSFYILIKIANKLPYMLKQKIVDNFYG